MLFKYPLPFALCLTLTLWVAGCQPQANKEPTMTPDVPASPGAGKNDKSAQPNLYRLNPTPSQGYELVLTIQGAPGPFKKMGWSALYQAKGCNFVVNDFAGVRGEPEHTLELPFTERPDGSFAATVYLDAMLDEDYYGNGVCQWTLAGVGAGGSPSGAPEETAFNGNIDLEHLLAEKPRSMFYWKGAYGTVVRKPDAQIQVSPVAFGSPDRSQFKPALQAELFSLTLTPRKVLP